MMPFQWELTTGKTAPEGPMFDHSVGDGMVQSTTLFFFCMSALSIRTSRLERQRKWGNSFQVVGKIVFFYTIHFYFLLIVFISAFTKDFLFPPVFPFPDSGGFLFVNPHGASGSTRDVARMSSVSVSPTPPAGRCLSFWYYAHGPHVNALRVYATIMNPPTNLVWQRKGTGELKPRFYQRLSLHKRGWTYGRPSLWKEQSWHKSTLKQKPLAQPADALTNRIF